MAVLKTVNGDVQGAVGPLQTCAGHQAGCEAAVHAMKEISTFDDTEAILPVDASNASVSIDKQLSITSVSFALQSLQYWETHTRPQSNSSLQAKGKIESTEGTTQGDPLVMAMYALAIRPLIDRLREAKPIVRQVWFADDATAAGRLATLRKWWQIVTTIGPDFGYNPNASKTHLVIKPKLIEDAKLIFKNTDVQISTNGQCSHRYKRVHWSICNSEDSQLGKVNWKSHHNGPYPLPCSVCSPYPWSCWKMALLHANHRYRRLSLPTPWGYSTPPINWAHQRWESFSLSQLASVAWTLSIQSK